MAVFKVDTLIRFGHTDPAGIVFYPRYFEMINNTVEDWFAEALGVSFGELVEQGSKGMPTVRTECDFIRPSRLGDVLTFELTVAKLGRSSVTLQISAKCQGEERLRALTTLVYADYSSPRMRAMPIPAGLRDNMVKYLTRGRSKVEEERQSPV